MRIIKSCLIIAVASFLLLLLVFGPFADMRNASNTNLYNLGTILDLLVLAVYACVLYVHIKIIIRKVKK